MAPYTIEQYLFDRALIDETTTRLWQTYDLKLSKEETISKIKKEVFGEQINIDYAALLGGEPYSTSGETQAEGWFDLMAKMTGTAHLIGPLVTDLPIPDGEVERPTKVEATRSLMVKLVAGDKLAQNGGVGRITLTRGNVKGNPWRITGLKLHNVAYNTGDNVFE